MSFARWLALLGTAAAVDLSGARLYEDVLGTAAAVDLSGARLYEDVVAYSKSGEHRTGSRNLKEARRWYVEELTKAGYAVETLPFTVPYFDFESCALTINDAVAVECFPVWPAAAGAAAGALGGAVAVVNASAIGLDDATKAAIAAKIAAGAGAVVVVNGANEALGADPNLPVALNVDVLSANASQAWGAPVVVAPAHPALVAGAGAYVEIAGTRRAVAGDEVVHAWLPAEGRFPYRPPVVVESGLSGWHACGGERGPGVALSLGVARWHAARQRNGTAKAPYHFFATAGHELGASMGLPDFYDRLADMGMGPLEVGGWLHAGSATVTYGAFPAAGVQRAECAYANGSAVGACAAVHLAAFAPAATSPGGGGGGVAELIDEGYEAVGFWGSFPRFHTRDDAADSTGPALLEPAAAAFVATLACLEDELGARGATAAP